MPILAKESDSYPPDLLDRDWFGEGDWWVMHTLPKREKSLARQLEKHRVAFYSPTFSRQYRSPAGRMRTSQILLFPNYVFVFGTPQDRLAALTTNCIARCIEVPKGGQNSLLDDLKRIRQVIEAGIDLTPEGQLQPGDTVRVKSGPMEGVIGTVVERRGKKRLIVEINFIQRGASVELRDLDVEPYTR
ncbi:MAG: KOW motif-containing protein [Planctomycetaceae bacterium]|nr:KOW motif-containing protein [Planctomycetaceae bacterium]MCA9029858.1 KOW motif-containing protein [Planctomycetaceae bacterium]MCA9045552.1 KOW motif-containing protein [Planctomycetaceae bacterium]MCB9951244.1 KOW motif-containing protein [Planctomycetaceae bacterium]